MPPVHTIVAEIEAHIALARTRLRALRRQIEQSNEFNRAARAAVKTAADWKNKDGKE